MKALLATFLLTLPATAAELKPATIQAFDQYIRQTEDRLNTANPFLWADQSTERTKRIRAGEILVQPVGPKPDRSVAGGGLLHDWVGSVFLPGATIEQTLALVQDYNHHKDVYK